MRWFRREHRSTEAGQRPEEAHGPLRARRFAVATPIRYRRLGEEQWHAGTTENLSCTGVLFQAQQSMAPQTPVVLRFRLPPELTGEAPVEVACEARTVRHSGPHDPKTVAASILEFRPAAQGKGPARVTAGGAQFDRRTLEMLHRVNNQMAIVVGSADLLLGESAHEPHVSARLAEIKRAALAAVAAIYEFARERDNEAGPQELVRGS